MRYLFTHLDDLWALTLIHLRLSLIPILLGLVMMLCMIFMREGLLPSILRALRGKDK